MRRTQLGLLAVVLLLVLGTAAVSAVAGPEQRRAVPESVEVLGATAVCPDVRQLAGIFQTRISVGAAPLPVGRAATGGGVVSSLVTRPATTTAVAIKEPGQVSVGLGTAVNDNGLVVSATGALATGLEVEEVFRANDGRFRGLANLRCEPPRREAWFVGASTGVIDDSQLVLANVDDTPATVDITAFGHAGTVDQRPGQGITVPPHARVVYPLDQLIPSRNWLVVKVSSRQGRVVAALRSVRTSGTTQLGFDFVPQAQPPASKVVVPGIPTGPGTRGLVIGNPGEDDTTVSVQVTLKDGQFVPQGMAEVTVPARRSISLPLTTYTDSSSVTATVTSTGAPVVAGAVLIDVQTFQVGPVRELAFGGSAVPLSGPALLTDLVIDRPTESTLLLSAPGEAATVLVTPIRVLGAVGSPPPARRIQVPAGRSVELRLTTFFPPGTQARLAVEVRPVPGSGEVYATRYLREHGARGTLSALLGLEGPDQQVARPITVQDDSAGYP